MVIVGVHYGGAAREVGQDVDAPLVRPEQPRLRIVSVCGECRIADQVARGCLSGQRITQACGVRGHVRRCLCPPPADPSCAAKRQCPNPSTDQQGSSLHILALRASRATGAEHEGRCAPGDHPVDGNSWSRASPAAHRPELICVPRNSNRTRGVKIHPITPPGTRTLWVIRNTTVRDSEICGLLRECGLIQLHRGENWRRPWARLYRTYRISLPRLRRFPGARHPTRRPVAWPAGDRIRSPGNDRVRHPARHGDGLSNPLRGARPVGPPR